MNNVPISFLIFVVTHHAYMHLMLIIKNLFHSFLMSYDSSKFFVIVHHLCVHSISSTIFDPLNEKSVVMHQERYAI